MDYKETTIESGLPLDPVIIQFSVSAHGWSILRNSQEWRELEVLVNCLQLQGTHWSSSGRLTVSEKED